MDECQAGDNVGCLLRGVKREDVVRGQVLAKPGSIKPHTQFKAQVYVLSKEEGGRHTPFLTGYRPQFYMRTTDVTGEVKLPEGVEMCMPGDNVVMDITLVSPIAIEPGLRFAIREGGKTVGAGAVTSRQVSRTRQEQRKPGQQWRRKFGSGSRPTTTGSWIRRRTRSWTPPPVRARARGAGPAPDQNLQVDRHPLAVHRQGLARAVRDAHAQADRRHPRPEPKVVDALMRLNLPTGVSIEIKL